MTDFDDEVSKQEMKVVSVSYTRIQTGGYAVSLDLIDPVSIEALGMYKELSWASTDMVSIIDHKDTLKPLMASKKPNFGKPKHKHENFCIPMNMSFYKLCNWLKENNNMLFFQNRKEFVIQPFSKLFGTKNTLVDKFVYKSNNQSYRRNIYELKADYANKVEANTLQPKSKVYSLDIFKKEPQETTEDYQSIIGKIKSPGKTPHDFGKTGFKHYYASEYSVEDYTEVLYSKNAYKDIILEIMVPGQFANNIGETVEVDLVNFFTGSEPEKNLNGEWLISEITDIFSLPDFVQRIVLTRSKFSK